MAAEDTVYRFVFEEGDGEGGSSAPSVRPGQAEAARRESSERQSVAINRRGDTDRPGRSSADKPATVGDVLRIFQKGFGSMPVIGRLAQVGGQIVAPLIDMVSALRELRKVLAANTAGVMKAREFMAEAVGRTTVRGYRVVTGAAEQARQAGQTERIAQLLLNVQRAQLNDRTEEFARFSRGLAAARQRAREARMLTIDAESWPAGGGSGSGRAIGPSRINPPSPINRLPAISRGGALAPGGAAAVSQPIMAQAVGAGGSGLAGAAIVAGAAAAVVVALGASVVATKALVGRANELAKRLEGFSGQLAASQARAEVARLQQQIASARKLGPDLARYTDARSRGEIALEKIYDSFTKAGLEAITPLLETAVKWLEAIAKHSDKFVDGVSSAAKFASRAVIVGGLLLDIKDILDSYQKQEQKKTDDEKRAAGSFEVLMTHIPDLNINDEATPAANIKRQNVGFGELGGEQMELP